MKVLIYSSGQAPEQRCRGISLRSPEGFFRGPTATPDQGLVTLILARAVPGDSQLAWPVGRCRVLVSPRPVVTETIRASMKKQACTAPALLLPGLATQTELSPWLAPQGQLALREARQPKV